MRVDPRFGAAVLAGVAFPLLFHAACRVVERPRRPELPFLDEALSRTAPAEIVFPAASPALKAAAIGDVWAKAIVRHVPRPCNVPGGNPLVWAAQRPIAGRPWEAQWTTRPTSPFPAVPVALFVSLRPDVPAAELPRAAGCVLQVPPDYVLAPVAGSLLTQDGGIVTLRWTPPAGLIGTTFRLQLVVADSRTEIGVTTTPMLEITVGSR